MSNITKRVLAALCAAGIWSLLAGQLLAGAIDIGVSANITGFGNTPIGNVNAKLGGPDGINQMDGLFTFTAPWAQLDQCYDFRWFQIITGAPEDTLAIPAFKWKDTSGDYTVTPTAPFVDQPKGGYKYQESAGGADNDPFYENTGPGMYHIPNFADTHTEGVSSSIYDNPTPEDVFFETYLVVTGGSIAANDFCVLAGFSWNTVTEAGVLEMPDPVAITPIVVAHLQTALNQSGFTAAGYNNAWTVSTGCELMPCPEPATWLLLGLGGVMMLGVRRVRRAA